MKVIINHREEQRIVVGDHIPIPVQGTNAFGETLDYTTLSLTIREIVETTPNESLSYYSTKILQTVVEADLYLDLQDNRP
jgi:dihydroneopterin aldolase